MIRRLAFGTLLLAYSPVFALEHLTLALGQAQGQGWRLEGGALAVRLSEPLSLSLSAARLEAGGISLAQPSIECSQAEYSAERVACAKGSLQADGQPASPLRFSYVFADSSFSFEIDKPLGLADQLQGNGGPAKTDLQFRRLQLDKLSALAARFAPHWQLPLELGGTLDLQASLKPGAEGLALTVDSQSTALRYATPDGKQAGEGLKLNLHLDAAQREGAWKILIQAGLPAGELYSAPFYFKQSGKPVTLRVDLNWKENALKISNLDFHDPQTGRLQGSAELGQAYSLVALNLDLGRTDLDALYRRYLQTWLEEHDLGQLQARGKIQGRLRWQGKNRELRLQIEQADLHDMPADGQGRFGLSGLDGVLAWRAGKGLLEDTRLAWRGAHLLGKIPLPAGSLHLRLDGDEIRLQSPFHLALLDGGVRLAHFFLRYGASPEVEFSGQLEPISMPVLSKTLGLPELGGQVSGVIPTVRYADSRLDIGGELRLKLFDGEVVIDRLALRDPLGDAPELTAEVDAQNLDLATLTRYIEFGEMTGRLSGYIRNLRLVAWQPASFDAYFATPADDKSRRTISQKAINSLSSLGGSDVAAALSRSVLRIFEQFSYERLGWGCKLENGTCQMRGVEPAGAGNTGAYYIVKGGGLPRIDVIGYNAQVDWEELLRRLKRVTKLQTGQAVVR